MTAKLTPRERVLVVAEARRWRMYTTRHYMTSGVVWFWKIDGIVVRRLRVRFGRYGHIVSAEYYPRLMSSDVDSLYTDYYPMAGVDPDLVGKWLKGEPLS